jgi:Arc/MetJ family transcription regulator
LGGAITSDGYWATDVVTSLEFFQANNDAATNTPRVRFPQYTYRTLYVYSWCMTRIRTNVELDEVYLKRIMDRYGIHTKTEAVDLALRHLAGQPMTREEALTMEGAHAIGEVPADSAPE